jgi:hypothetical protein
VPAQVVVHDGGESSARHTVMKAHVEPTDAARDWLRHPLTGEGNSAP